MKLVHFVVVVYIHLRIHLVILFSYKQQTNKSSREERQVGQRSRGSISKEGRRILGKKAKVISLAVFAYTRLFICFILILKYKQAKVAGRNATQGRKQYRRVGSKGVPGKRGVLIR